jgi:predicted RNase H-like nuclease
LIKKYEQIEPLILIDIPIGLKNGGKGERLPDLGARRILKARKSSIFPIPCREAVYMESYKKACEVNEKLTGKRISKQAWNIVSKIRDVNNFLVENEIFRKKKGSGT